MQEKQPISEDPESTLANTHRKPHGVVRRYAPYVAAGLLVAGASVGTYYGFKGEGTPKPAPTAESTPTPATASCDKISMSYTNDGRTWEATVSTSEAGGLHVSEVHVIFDALNSKDQAEEDAHKDPQFEGFWQAEHTYKVPGEKMISAQVFTEGSNTPLTCKPADIETGDFNKDALGNIIQ